MPQLITAFAPPAVGPQPCSQERVYPSPHPPPLHRSHQTRRSPPLPHPAAFSARTRSPTTRTTSSKWQGGSPMTRQANAPRARRTDNVYFRQAVPWWHRPTHKINSVAIHNHVNHLSGDNIAPFVNSWSTAKVHFDLQWRSFPTSTSLENDSPCVSLPVAPSLAPMPPSLRHASSGAPFQDPVCSSSSARDTAARLSKLPRTSTPSVTLLFSYPFVTTQSLCLPQAPVGTSSNSIQCLSILARRS